MKPYVHICMCLYIYIYVHICLCLQKCINTICIYIFTCVYIYIHILGSLGLPTRPSRGAGAPAGDEGESPRRFEATLFGGQSAWKLQS